MNNMSPIVKAVLTTVFFVAALMAVWYVKDVIIDKGTFEPNWLYAVILGVLCFGSELFFSKKQQ